ncbi:outer membrane protein transport protein [Pseudomonas sp. D8002]|uniref:OmpP1/FadL family transporter n=1 Tax=unclassified Pseudomonas TaxID=196821 RepID=UPI0015A06A14|nr:MULTISPECIES: outer membrane protein transport protein [unclassified Pseudomonas]NWA91418.1 outer membrane protein transport protein [Pseudomonas sp. D8002]NWB20991.1 outer membrane protein transport protein [Pseudomonas sp. D4002]
MKLTKFSLVSTLSLLSASVMASNGTIMSGYGTKNSMMGGASIALPLDSIAAANNPAGMGKVGTRVDFGLRIFHGDADNSFHGNDNEIEDMTMAIPEMGANYQFSDDVTIGLSVFGSGMATDYEKQVVPIPGLSKSSNTLNQITIAPTITKRFGESFYVGFSPTIMYTSIETNGVPGKKDTSDSATAYGFRVGALWEATEQLSLGMMYTPRTKAGEWGRYKNDIFASSNGRFDAPEQLGVGFAYKVAPGTTIAADAMRIYWGDVDFLNAKGGSGYEDMTVYRIGISQDITDRLVFRAGYSHADKFARSEYADGLFRGPGISNKSFALGFSYALSDGYDLQLGYERQLPEKLEGSGASTGTRLDVDYNYILFGVSKSF